MELSIGEGSGGDDNEVELRSWRVVLWGQEQALWWVGRDRMQEITVHFRIVSDQSSLLDCQQSPCAAYGCHQITKRASLGRRLTAPFHACSTVAVLTMRPLLPIQAGRSRRGLIGGLGVPR
jgi:hypothetical protein